jgi:hypothetical protein
MLVVLALAGVGLAALQLPGTWLILAAAVGYDWYHDFAPLGWKGLAALAGVALIAEVLDSLLAVLGARRAGASRRAAVGALLGGFLGMFLLSLPMPLIGTIIGGLLGCFAGAFIAELTHSRHAGIDPADRLVHGARVGAFAALGRTLGLVAKTAAALVMAGTSVLLAIVK